jgi:hypothetical protein
VSLTEEKGKKLIGGVACSGAAATGRGRGRDDEEEQEATWGKKGRQADMQAWASVPERLDGLLHF